MRKTTWLWWVGLLVACGGKAVIDHQTPGAGGQGGSGNTVATAVSTATGPTACNDHSDCPDGLCIYATGLCSPRCEVCDPCGPGSLCHSCATSSCPQCRDCLAACVPTEPGRCDDHDDCSPGELCIYPSQQCARDCASPADCQPGQICADCITSSCPCCDDCRSACSWGG